MNLSEVMKHNPTYLVADLKIIKRGRNVFYIDERTKPTLLGEKPVVKPIAWNHTDFWIVCPYCQRIHMFPVLKVRRNNQLAYCHCKGRLMFPGEQITDILEKQSPIIIDETGVKAVSRI